MSKQLLTATVALVYLLTLTGCTSQQGAENRKIIEQPNGKLTVLEDSDKPKSNEVALVKVERLENTLGLDWLSNEALLVAKENTQLKQIQVEGGLMYPRNLNAYSLETKDFTGLRNDPALQGGAMVSPDGQHVFYQNFHEAMSTGFIMDSAGKNTTQVTKDDDSSLFNGHWVNNQQVLLQNYSGDIYLADISGKQEVLTTVRGPLANSLALLGNKLYYNKPNGQMYVTDLQTKGNQQLKDNVVWIIPAPKADRLALVKRTGETSMTLSLTDLEGNETTLLSEGTQVFGTSWSPDQTKIAYTVISEGAGLKGLFVADVETGKITQLSADIGYAAGPVRWSPDSKKLVVANFETKEDKNVPVTYLFTIK